MLISIIVAAYNTDKFLPKCVESILSQSFTDFELLLIDDGSTDKSGELCEAFSKKDSRVRVFHKENGGASSARNVGIEHSQGKWICFVDSDDYLPCDALVKYQSLISDDIDLVMTKYRIIDSDTGLEREYTKYEERRRFSQEEFLAIMYDTGADYHGYICSKLFRHSIISKHKIRFNENIFFNEDRLFIVQFACSSEKPVLYEASLTYCYVLHSSSAMSSLKRGYNRKFVTDFDALVIMKKMITNQSTSQYLKNLATWAIIDSYEWNHRLMLQFGDYDSKNHWHMVKGLIKSGCFLLFLKKSIYPFMMLIFPKCCIKEIQTDA